MKQKCSTCYEPIKPDCDWRQGRCPHRRPMIEDITVDQYKARFYNLLKTIKRLFKGSK
jgi:hypothetical protein